MLRKYLQSSRPIMLYRHVNGITHEQNLLEPIHTDSVALEELPPLSWTSLCAFQVQLFLHPLRLPLTHKFPFCLTAPELVCIAHQITLHSVCLSVPFMIWLDPESLIRGIRSSAESLGPKIGIRTLRLKEVKQLAQDHKHKEWHS